MTENLCYEMYPGLQSLFIPSSLYVCNISLSALVKSICLFSLEAQLTSSSCYLGWQRCALRYFLMRLGYFLMRLGYFLMCLGYFLMRLGYFLMRLGYFLMCLGYFLMCLGYFLMRLGYFLMCLGYFLMPPSYHATFSCIPRRSKLARHIPRLSFPLSSRIRRLRQSLPSKHPQEAGTAR